MNLMSVLRALLPKLHSDPITALHQADAVLSLLAFSPSLLVAVLPASSNPIVAYAKAHPEEIVAFLQAELALLEKYPGLTTVLVMLVPNG